MSFFSDLVEGNFNQLGGDLTSPSAISEYEDAGIALGGLALGGIGFGLLGGAELGAGALGADTLLGADTAALGDIGAATAGADLSAGAIAGDVGALSTAADPIVADEALSFAPAAAGGDVLPFSDPGLLTDSSGLFTQDAGVGGDTLTSTLGADTTTTTTATTPNAGITPASSATGLPTGPAVNASTTGTVGGGATSGGTVSGMGGTAAAPSSGGFTGTLNSIMSSPYTRLATALAPVGLALAMGNPSLPAAGQQSQAYANQLAAYGQQQLALGTSGQLTPAQSSVIAQMQQDLTNQWRQALANQGVQDPTKDGRWPMIQSVIDQQVSAATQQMLQQTIQNGLTALGQGGQQLAALSQQQLQADQNFTNMLVNATKGLGSAFAGQTSIKVTAA